jgi:hypothetical protein
LIDLWRYEESSKAENLEAPDLDLFFSFFGLGLDASIDIELGRALRALFWFFFLRYR